MVSGVISWGIFHRVHEEDRKRSGNLRAATKLTPTVLHPGNCKQNVPTALAVFDPSTIASIRLYFRGAQDSADFLNLIYTWWSISISKKRYNSRNKLGNAAVYGDGKPDFLRKFADWLQEWQNQKIPNSQKFTLSAQTSSALIHTLRCHAALIEDLVFEGYEFNCLDGQISK